MHELAEWRDFYVMIGTASGAIVGASFIVATLTANLEKRSLGMRGFITPTTVHLSSVLVGAAILMVPTLTRVSLAVLLGAGGIGGILYSLTAASRIWHLTLDIDDRVFYIVLPIVAYAAIATASLMCLGGGETSFETLAVALVALLVIGLRNAWDMATFVIMQGDKKKEGE
jgi:hypothetical protein